MLQNIYINARFLTQQTTGVQRFAIEICKELIKLNPNIKFVAPRNIFHPMLEKELGVITFGLFSSHLWEQIELPLFLRKRGNPLLLNLCNTGPLLYKNQIVCIHDLAFMVNPSWFSKSFSTVYNFVIPKIAHNSKHIFTVSNASKNEIVKFLSVPESKVNVVYNGVNFKHFASKPAIEKSEYLLSVSSIDPRKNLTFLINTFLKWNHPTYKLLIIGGKSATFADQKFVDNDKIKFLGYVSDEDLVNYYQHCKAFVYPSLYEGFGLPPLEALSFGSQVIVSDIPSLREVCGDNAFAYFDPKSEESLIDSMNLLVNNQNNLEKKSFDLSKYSWKKSAEEINNFLVRFAK